MLTDDANSGPHNGAENAGTSKKFIGSALVLASIVVLGLVLSLTNLFGDNTKPTPNTLAPSTSTSTSSPTSPTNDASVCGLTAVEMSGTLTTSPPATWALVGTTAAPSITGQGPGKIDDDSYRSCYARTPTGALLAASNYSALGSYGPVRKRFYEQGTVPGPGRDALLKKPITGAGDGGTRVQIAGFRVLKYNGEQADIDLAFRTSNGAIGAVVLNLQWSGGDWKIRLADDGKELSPFVQLPSLSGYIFWAGA
jgi:hypothetical protein